MSVWPRQWRSRDALEQIGAVSAGMIVFVFAMPFVHARWHAVLFFGLFWASNMMLKLLRPNNANMSNIGWLRAGVTAILVMAGAFLLFNSNILGGWTLPALILVFFIYGVWSLAADFEARRDE